MSDIVITKDETTKTMTIKKSFDVPSQTLWHAWTTQEMLEKWWAPAPWTAGTVSFDFSEGGHWHYFMAGPDGDKVYGWAAYKTIEDQHRFIAEDVFCDADGKPSGDMAPMVWDTQFDGFESGTRVTIVITFGSAEDLHKTLEMGFEEGFTLGMNQLEALLKK